MNKFKNGDVVIFKGEKSVNAYFRKLGIRPATPYRVQAVQEGYVFLYGKKPGIHGALVRKAIKDPMDFQVGNIIQVVDNTVHLGFNGITGKLLAQKNGDYYIETDENGSYVNIGKDPIIKVIEFSKNIVQNDIYAGLNTYIGFKIGDIVHITGRREANIKEGIEDSIGSIINIKNNEFPLQVLIGDTVYNWKPDGDIRVVHRNDPKKSIAPKPKVPTVKLQDGRIVTKESYEKAKALLVDVK